MSDRDNPAAGGLRFAFTRLAGSTFGLLRSRLELAGVELAEERERLQARLGLLFAGILLLLFGVLGFGAFIVVYFWDTYRLTAILLVALVCLIAGLVLLWRARSMGDSAPAPFAATIAEFEKDRAWLSGQSESLAADRSLDR